MSPEEDQVVQLQMTRAYYKGARDGVTMFAHWKHGAEYVGTTGKLLAAALLELDAAEAETLKKYSVKELELNDENY